jgi:fermentation-respiration switch protein FrsA (DUF1100 family)
MKGVVELRTWQKCFVKIGCLFGAVYLALCLLLLFFQNRIIFLPTSGQAVWSAGLRFEELSLPVESGARVAARFVEAGQSRGVVLFCHGNAGNLTHREETVHLWRRLGWDVLIFDYEGYGESRGRPSEQGCYRAALAAYEWLKSQKKLQSRPLLIHGRSLGGAVATGLAHEKGADGLILESTFTSVPAMARTVYPFLPTAQICRIKFDSLSRLPALKMPALFIHSREDEMIPFFMARQLYDAYPGTKRFFELQGGHNDGFAVTPGYEQALMKFAAAVVSDDGNSSLLQSCGSLPAPRRFVHFEERSSFRTFGGQWPAADTDPVFLSLQRA